MHGSLEERLERLEHNQRLTIRLLIATLRKENDIMSTSKDTVDKANAILALAQAESNTIDALVIAWDENQKLLVSLKAALDAATAAGDQSQIDTANAALDQAITAITGNTAKEAAIAAPTAPPVVLPPDGTGTPTTPADGSTSPTTP